MKSLYRSPIRTLLTLILLAAVTFAFFSRTAEYAILTREMNSAALRYRGVGAVEIEPANINRNTGDLYIYTDPRLEGKYELGDVAPYINRYKPLTYEQIDALAELPYISSVSARYMTAGISDTYTRILDNYYMRRVVFEATLSDVWRVKTGENDGIGASNINRLIVHDIKYLTDTPTQPSPLFMSSIFLDDIVRYEILVGPRLNPIWGAMGVSSYGYTGMEAELTDYIFDDEFLDSLTPGSRYVFVAQARVPSVIQGIWMEGAPALGDYITDCWCAPVQLIDGAPENYLETQEFAELKKLIELTNTDLRAFDTVYTDDMDAIMRFAEGNMTILDGRALTQEDSRNNAQICVISRILSEEIGLEIGDTLTMKLGTELFEQYNGLGALAITQDRYKPAEMTVTLEVVGIWRDVDTNAAQQAQPNWNYSANTIFVPKSLLPVDESTLAVHEYSPAEVSITIDSAWNIAPFLEESAPKIGEMGLTLIFQDAGWPEIEAAFSEAGRLSVINIIVFSAATAAATLLAVYLFIGRKKKEYAIMRALGTTRQTSAKSLLLPLAVIAAVSILAGTGAAWIYTVRTVGNNNTLLTLEKYTVDTSIPSWVVIVCLIGQLTLTFLFAAALLRRIGKQSPLALLSANSELGIRKAKSKESNASPDTDDNNANPSLLTPHSTPPTSNSTLLTPHSTPPTANSSPLTPDSSLRIPHFALRYISKHIRRSAAKSALTILLSALLLAAVGQLAYMKQSYIDLIANTEIVATFAGGLPINAMHNIMNNSLVGKTYYERETPVGMDIHVVDLAATNNIARFTGEEPDITFIDGYDSSCMEEPGNIIIAGKALMERYGLEPGGTVELSNFYTLRDICDRQVIDYRGDHPDDTATYEEILEIYRSRIMDEIRKRKTEEYTIVGVVTTPSGEYDGMIFSPGSRAEFWGLLTAEISPIDNMRAEELREYGERIANSTGSINFVIDTSRLDGPIKTLKLVESLYPGALAAALLIGGFLCCLLILQSSKEAALMRMLGTTKRKTRAILSLERVILSIVGLAPGAAALLIYNGPALSAVAPQLCIFAAIYTVVIISAAIISSVLVTRRRALELLQTKE